MIDEPMEFEVAMRLIFGKRADHIAGEITVPKYRREWLRKAVRRLRRDVNNLDSDPAHIDSLNACMDRIERAIRSVKEPTWHLVDRQLVLICHLLGYFSLRGARVRSLHYFQDRDQYDTASALSGGDVMASYLKEKSLVSKRHEVVKRLHSDGYNTFEIGIVMNQSEHQIKKLMKSGV